MIGPLSVQPDLLLATTLGTTSSQTADRMHVVSYGYHFFLRFFICIVFQFLFVWRECLVHQVPIVLTVLSFRFSGLCLMVVIATIHFHGQASPVGVWSFLRLPLNPSRGKKKEKKKEEKKRKRKKEEEKETLKNSIFPDFTRIFADFKRHSQALASPQGHRGPDPAVCAAAS